MQKKLGSLRNFILLSALISLTDYDVKDLIKIGTYAAASSFNIMYVL